MTLTFGSLFTGIGGIDLGLERAGMICKWQSEIDPFCNKVLAKHWPMVRRYGDIKEIGKHNLESVDLICGGFPCQPFSVAGKQRGKEDDRYLWPEMLRVISEVKPTWVIGENVPGIIRMELDKVLSDLENQGYETQTFIIPACGVDAPHRRDRVWIVANAECNGCGSKIKCSETDGKKTVRSAGRFSGSSQVVADAFKQQRNGRLHRTCRRIGESEETLQNVRRRGRKEDGLWLPEPGVGRVANGVPRRVERLRSLGNAVVPQVVEIIGRFIMKIEDQI